MTKYAAFDDAALDNAANPSQNGVNAPRTNAHTESCRPAEDWNVKIKDSRSAGCHSHTSARKMGGSALFLMGQPDGF